MDFGARDAAKDAASIANMAFAIALVALVLGFAGAFASEDGCASTCVCHLKK